jgi:hypothetical protein
MVTMSKRASTRSISTIMGERNYWMIGADGKSYGPTDLATMVRWINERRVTQTTQVSQAEAGPWQDAQEWDEFSSALGLDSVGPSHASSQPPPPPPAGAWAPPSSPQPSVSVGAGMESWPPSNLQVVLLIGAISNLLWGVKWLVGLGFAGFGSFGISCCCCPIAALPLVVGVMQCMDYSAARRMGAARYLDRTQVWGIVNIASILFLNVPALVCGILQCAWLGDARRKYLLG